jgi:hypothetical protein
VTQTDATATVTWRVEYEPYGEVFAYRTGATRHQPLRFPGQEYDSAAPERAYNIFRWYRAGWGRYTIRTNLASARRSGCRRVGNVGEGVAVEAGDVSGGVTR